MGKIIRIFIGNWPKLLLHHFHPHIIQDSEKLLYYMKSGFLVAVVNTKISLKNLKIP